MLPEGELGARITTVGGAVSMTNEVVGDVTEVFPA